MTCRFIYKVLNAEQWISLDPNRQFEGTPLDVADGFIHFSTADQLAGTLQKYFADEDQIRVLQVPVERVEADLRWERSGENELFPHLFAALDWDYVTRVELLERDTQGVHRLPDDLH